MRNTFKNMIVQNYCMRNTSGLMQFYLTGYIFLININATTSCHKCLVPLAVQAWQMFVNHLHCLQENWP